MYEANQSQLNDGDSIDSLSVSSEQEPRKGLTRRMKAAIAVSAVVVAVVVVAVVVSQVAKRSTAASQAWSVDYCSHLSEENAKNFCHEYHISQGASKFSAAANWRHYNQASYNCSGINAECLNGDLESNAAGTTCQPLAEGAACGDDQKCSAGFCGGPPAGMAAESEAHTPVAAAPVTTVTMTATPDKTAQSSTVTTAADDTKAADVQITRMPAMPAGPNATWPTAVATVWPGNLGVKVPDTFLATSHEWKRMGDYGGVNIAAWAEIFKLLGPSPVLRIGGASQDAMTEVPGEDTWAAMQKLQKTINCRYIIGLPLWQKNAIDMSQQIIAAAQEHLGDALLGFELGNEPEFWPTGLGGYDEKGQWQSGFEPFAAYFHRVATALNPCSDGKPILSGPGWGNVNTQDPSWFAKVVSQGKCYLWESNTHYYPYINNETATAPELLSQWLQDFALDKFKAYVGLAKKAGLPVRISETNSMYGGGRVGLSDTMVGTFWTIDALFAFANAGAVAFHLHWGKGGDPAGDNPPSVGVQTNFILEDGKDPYPWPSVHAPWYGFLFWTIATAGGYGKAADSTFVAANVERWNNCTANIKVYALKADGTGGVRVALINKDLNKSCNVDIRIDEKYCSNNATVSRLLPGPLGIYSKAGITWRGQHYMTAATSGKLQGNVEKAHVKPQLFAGKPCSFNIALPAATAALLEVMSSTVSLTQ